MRYFISGHIDITHEEFLLRYSDQINVALNDTNCSFLIGDSDGTDKYAQDYLYNKIDNSKITIYHIGKYCKNNLHNYQTSGNYKNHTQKDEAMTLNSDIDILWIRSEDQMKQIYGSKYRKRISGTEKNLIRRQQMNNEQ